jgi:hypothetical protein
MAITKLVESTNSNVMKQGEIDPRGWNKNKRKGKEEKEKVGKSKRGKNIEHEFEKSFIGVSLTSYTYTINRTHFARKI